MESVAKLFSIIMVLTGLFSAGCFASLEPPSVNALKSSNPVLRITLAGLAEPTSLLVRLSHGNKLQHFGAKSGYATGPSGSELRFNLASGTGTIDLSLFIDNDDDGKVSSGDGGYFESGIALDESTGPNEFGTNGHRIADVNIDAASFETVTAANWGTMTTTAETDWVCQLAVAGDANFTASRVPADAPPDTWFWFTGFTTNDTAATFTTDAYILPGESTYDLICTDSSGTKTEFSDIDFSSPVVLDL